MDAGATRIYLDFEYRLVSCPVCGVRQERLAWLSDTRRFTLRFATAVGRQCRELSVARVAEMHQLSWGQVRRLEIVYMENLLAQHPPAQHLRAIGMDEISIRKGHSYAIVAADLDRRRPIWMSETPGRAEEDLDRFYNEIGPKRCEKIQLAIMDMWKPFRNSTKRHAPQARILFDKFHVIKHLGNALDAVRRSEYQRVNGTERKFIKGQRYTLLSHRANLNADGRRSLRLLLKANKRLHKACLIGNKNDRECTLLLMGREDFNNHGFIPILKIRFPAISNIPVVNSHYTIAVIAFDSGDATYELPWGKPQGI